MIPSASGLLRLTNPVLRLPGIYRRLLKRSVVVFLYHEVSENPSPFNRRFGLNVRPEIFARQMEMIRDQFSLPHPPELLEGDSRRPAALITFDDGNAGYFTNALPILKGMQIPSLAFLNMGTVRGEVCWSGLVTYLQLYEPGFRNGLMRTPSGDDYVHFTKEEVARYLERVDAETLFSRVRAFRGRIADSQQVEAASHDPLVYFGNHLYNHYNATLLSERLLEEAYRRNQEALDRFPRGLRFVSYPFGRADETTHARLSRLGVQAVFVGEGIPNFHRQGRCFARISITDRVEDEPALAKTIVRNVVPEFCRRWKQCRIRPRLPAVNTLPRADSIRDLSEAIQQLKLHCPDVAVLAIPWVHMRHPIHPAQQELMEEVLSEGRLVKTQRKIGFLVGAGRVGLCLLYAAHLTVRILRWRVCMRREIQALKRQPFDLIAKTWISSSGSHPSVNGHDFYYGDLQERLKKRRLRMLLLFGDLSTRNRPAHFRPLISTAYPWRLPELCLVPPTAPFQMLFYQVLSALRLRRFAAEVQDPLIRWIVHRARRDILSRQIIPTGLYYWIGKSACRSWKPKAFMTLYEGQPWEMLLRRGVKEADPHCQTIGYQHTVVMPHSFALLSPGKRSRELPAPDLVLCLGEISRKTISPGHQAQGTRLINFGTFRRILKGAAPSGPRPHLRTVLVVPEGVVQETRLLFNFAMEAAARLPDYRFIFRCHPMYPLDVMRPHLERSPEGIPNVMPSNGHSLEEDCARSSLVLYRGSSTVLYAILNGLKPIYLKDNQPLCVDPLYQMEGWREQISSLEELERALRSYEITREDQAVSQWRKALAYVDAYAAPVNDESMDQLVHELLGDPK